MLRKQITKYGMVGVISTLIHMGAASLFVRLVYESFVISNIAGFCCAVCFSYAAQSRFVFDSGLSYRKALRFLLVQVIALILAINAAQLAETVSIYAKIFMVAVFLPVCAFFVHKLWTFAGPAGGPGR
ncbi:MAG TPA: GtrA family protein [Desulfotignum sp.]|nr:GtrA family protein [Desulfotignum sp.]